MSFKSKKVCLDFKFCHHRNHEGMSIDFCEQLRDHLFKAAKEFVDERGMLAHPHDFILWIEEDRNA